MAESERVPCADIRGNGKTPEGWIALTALQLQRLLDRAGLSQRAASKALDINERTMRRYVAGDAVIPKTTELALFYLASRAGIKA